MSRNRKLWPFPEIKRESLYDPIHVAFESPDELKKGWSEMCEWEQNKTVRLAEILDCILPTDVIKWIVKYIPTPAAEMSRAGNAFIKTITDPRILHFWPRRRFDFWPIWPTKPDHLFIYYHDFLTKFTTDYSLEVLVFIIVSLAQTRFLLWTPVISLFIYTIFGHHVIDEPDFLEHCDWNVLAGDLLALMRFPTVVKGQDVSIYCEKLRETFGSRFIEAQRMWIHGWLWANALEKA